MINLELINQVVLLIAKAQNDYYLSPSDYQKDLVLAKRGIDILLSESKEGITKA